MLNVQSFEVGEPSCWTGVNISDVVEVRQVENLSESLIAPDQPYSSTTVPPRSPGEKMQKNATLALAATPKRLF